MTPDGLSMTERLDHAPWRPIHTRILLGLGVGWALDSFEVQIIGSVLTPLAKDFGLLDATGSIAPSAVSMIWVVWFSGLMIGATTFGWLADRLGRRRLFVATLLLYSIATVASAFAPTFVVFLCFRFVTALGVGGEYSAVTSAVGEFMPVKRRGAAVASTLNFWSIGGIVAGLVGITFLNGFVAEHLVLGGVALNGWRFCLLAGAVAAIYAIFARRLIPESPRWLAAQGRFDEAEAVITAVSGIPGGGQRAGRSAPRRAFGAQLRELWTHWRGRLIYGMTLEFAGSAAYYGLFTFVAAYVLVPGRVNVSEAGVPVYYLVGNVGALLGGLAVAGSIDRLGRKRVVLGAYGCAAVSVVLLALAAAAGSPALTLVTFTLCVFAATCCWISAYTTFAELFPTELRATGVGVSVAAGRLGGMIGVVGLSYTVGLLGLLTAFALLAGFFLLGVLATLIWRTRGTEARGLTLEEAAPLAATAS